MEEAKRCKPEEEENGNVVEDVDDCASHDLHPAFAVTDPDTVAVASDAGSGTDCGADDVKTVVEHGVNTFFAGDYVPLLERASRMSAIIANPAENHRGDLFRVGFDVVTFWMTGELPRRTSFTYHPDPTIYKDWFVADGGVHEKSRRAAYRIWSELPRVRRPFEGFFYWLHSTLAMLAIHDSPEHMNTITGLMRESSRHNTTATLYVQDLLRFNNNFTSETTHKAMQAAFAKSLLYSWAATNIQAIIPLLNSLEKKENKDETQCWTQWWMLDSVTGRRLSQCNSSPPVNVRIPAEAQFVFVN